MHDIARTYIDGKEVKKVLPAAGVAEGRYAMPLMAVKRGKACFFKISEAEAHHFNLLQRKDS